MKEIEKINIIENSKVTLDGLPASIYGIKNAYGTVCNKKQRWDYSWPIIKRVITEKEGRFHS